MFYGMWQAGEIQEELEKEARIQRKYTAQNFLIKKYRRSKADMLTSFHVDLEQARVIWEEGNLSYENIITRLA